MYVVLDGFTLCWLVAVCGCLATLCVGGLLSGWNCVTKLVVGRLAVHFRASFLLLKATERSEGGSRPLGRNIQTGR